jgi:hypothetical protein
MKSKLYAVVMLFLLPSVCLADSPLGAFSGYWRGTAVGTLSAGAQEKFSCTSNNSPQGGDGLRIVLRCANKSGLTVLIYASIRAPGGTVSGTWEERTYNISGTMRGKISGSSISVHIESSSYHASLSISRTGNSSLRRSFVSVNESISKTTKRPHEGPLFYEMYFLVY